MMQGRSRTKKYRAAIVLALAVFAVLLVLLVAYSTAGDMRPTAEKIESQFAMTLPDNVRDTGLWTYTWNGYVILAKFTVDSADLDSTLESVQDAANHCIKDARTDDFLPDFYVNDSLPWWKPFTASVYSGVSCHDAPPDGVGPNMNVMVDTSQAGEATVYIERYSTDKGKRALRDT